MWEKYLKPAREGEWRVGRAGPRGAHQFRRRRTSSLALVLSSYLRKSSACIYWRHAQGRLTARDEKDPSVRSQDLADPRRIMRRQRLSLNQLVRQADPIERSLVQHDVPRVPLPRALEDVAYFPLDARLAMFQCDCARDVDRGFAVVDSGEVRVAGFGEEDEQVAVAAAD